MHFKRAPSEQPSREAVDGVIDAYVRWREASAGVSGAYLSWTSALVSEREAAFVEYRLALDREERAAALYQAIVEGISHGPASPERSLAQP